MANPPALSPLFAGSTTLAKPDLGTKRVCPSCASRFYDLQKRPIECPKCAFTFEPEALLKQRRTRLPEPVAKPVPVVVADEDEAEEVEDEETGEEAPEGEDEAEEAEEAAEVVEEAPIETEDAESEDGEPAAAEDTAESEDDFEDDDEEEDDTLLEEVEEDEDDVSGIIDADIEKDEP
jgi:uncharacterized protein (TIGR02300 family)